jgi:ribonuclease PH
MLPGSTLGRKPRDKAGKVDGRSVEIQRLIGRSLRAVLDMAGLGERTLWVDCDVLQADGGTRTAAISGAFVAVVDALAATPDMPEVRSVLRDSVAAVSVGVVAGEARLDLEYVEDKVAEVDMNLVMTGKGQFIEAQGTGEGSTFDRAELQAMLALGQAGIAAITAAQADALGPLWR